MDRQTDGQTVRQIEIQRDGQLERQRWRQFQFQFDIELRTCHVSWL